MLDLTANLGSKPIKAAALADNGHCLIMGGAH
jgi:hypothetical protein